MDYALSPFFSAGVLFGLVGFMVGRFQREYRWRSEARSNLAAAVARTDRDRHDFSASDSGTLTGSDGDRYANGGTFGARREARRLAVRGNNVRVSPDSVLVGSGAYRTDAPPVGKRRLGNDCG